MPETIIVEVKPKGGKYHCPAKFCGKRLPIDSVEGITVVYCRHCGRWIQVSALVKK